MPNLARARAVYAAIRDCWVAGGCALEAHERLSLMTVAAGMRGFAFLQDIDQLSQSTIAQMLTSTGLTARPCSSPFDLEFQADGISPDTIETYCRVVREISPFNGLETHPESPMATALSRFGGPNARY
jgi:hypothetical protein